MCKETCNFRISKLTTTYGNIFYSNLIDATPSFQYGVPNTKVVESFKDLVDETYHVGSAVEPGLIVDAIGEGAIVGYAI